MPRVEFEQGSTNGPGSVVYEFRAGWHRFWALSWWWKGGALGVSAVFLLAIIGGAAADDEETPFVFPTPRSDGSGVVREMSLQDEVQARLVVERFFETIRLGDRRLFEEVLSDSLSPSARGELVAAFSAWQQTSASQKNSLRVTSIVLVLEGGSYIFPTVSANIEFMSGDSVTLRLDPPLLSCRVSCTYKVLAAEGLVAAAATGREGGSPGLSDAEVEELISDTETAVLVIDAFWARHWSEIFDNRYRSPRVSGGYFGNENPSCDGQSVPGAGNAYYCPADDYIAWDWDLFASKFADEEIGDSFVFFVVAHEWGHAVQARLNQSLVTVDRELQADCLAAAAITGASEDGDLLMEPGDRGEIFQSLAAVADEVEWGNATDHGAADERIEAYQLGERGGARACFTQ